ncbi:hypothetical protein BJY00DRAFT_47440 [Aspergillus carlsbadensis]|nr:hypothetical protein BJY00DRAFT_47440 [Aspergillus carlsbadensis]
MTITEVLLPVLKGDPESLASFTSHASQISSHLAGTPGLQFFAHGRILFEGGNPVAMDSGRTALLFEWDASSSLHAFYPHSPAFQGFLGLMKPFLAQGDTPLIFEAVTSARETGSAAITQIIRVRQGPETEGTWGRLQEALRRDGNTDTAGAKPVFARAVGVEGQEGMALATIGWRSLEDYERARNDGTTRGILGELGPGGEMVDLVVRLERIQVEERAQD